MRSFTLNSTAHRDHVKMALQATFGNSELMMLQADSTLAIAVRRNMERVVWWLWLDGLDLLVMGILVLCGSGAAWIRENCLVDRDAVVCGRDWAQLWWHSW